MDEIPFMNSEEVDKMFEALVDISERSDHDVAVQFKSCGFYLKNIFI